MIVALNKPSIISMEKFDKLMADFIKAVESKYRRYDESFRSSHCNKQFVIEQQGL